ncbi:hypothetical protein DRW03_28855 [Corallococcus sp. H22C18031201]|uniref:hypothetical protein n=1 Tax=Citreicoccus inhibens TaxID=2849499 RepID=UPI000E71507A|nr:hypothetical protein [Citreicoccus inhibens]MBU8899442.1 nucleoside 2-deoxyribosyltransferase [Citreicoccus inhibens]RJS17123.1 hypothetical protein DRW03_28855 [Corallococcus sp. H22C18031201]
MSGFLDVVVEVGDVTDIRADAVLLKFAQGFHGADGAVSRRLSAVGISPTLLQLKPGEHRFIDTQGGLGAPLALFLGTARLREFDYHRIREFAGQALQLLESRPEVKHLAGPVHGPNYGLDEDEAVLAFVGGMVDAFQQGVGPRELARITVVEIQPKRVARMRRALEGGLTGAPGVEPLPGGVGFRIQRMRRFIAPPPMASAGAPAQEKPHAFVAMPFAPELEDTFHYGIQGPVKAAGLLCERVDQAVFDGPIIQRIRDRIDTAKVVIADLSLANPNVYLEVGYAWGRGKPTLLLVRDLRELRFDVASYRCLEYRSIRNLEELLTRELQRLG